MTTKQAAICLLLALSATPALAQSRPVMIGHTDEYDACPTLARVKGLNPRGDGFLSVRAGPGTGNREIDRLENGDAAFMCDEAGDWVGIVYDARGVKPGSERDCGVGSSIPRKKRYDGPCRSGWVHKRFLEIIAG